MIPGENGKRVEYELESGGLYLDLAAAALRIDQKAKISEKFFVSPRRRSTKNMQACSSSAGRLGPCGLIVCHIFLSEDRE